MNMMDLFVQLVFIKSHRRTYAMSDWQDISTAPRDGTRILLYGIPTSTELVRYTEPGVHSGYYDEFDQLFCLSESSWQGPFIEPTHWQPLPPPPETER